MFVVYNARELIILKYLSDVILIYLKDAVSVDIHGFITAISI